MATHRLPPITAPLKDFESGAEGSGVSLTATGLGQLEQKLRSLGKVYRDAAGYAMEEMASEIIKDAQENYVPWDHRHLIGSGRWDKYDPKTTASVITIAMWFGGVSDLSSPDVAGFTAVSMPEAGVSPAVESLLRSRRGEVAVLAIHGVGGKKYHNVPPSEYARYQHETLELVHPNGGGPKYLEIPFLKAYPRIYERIATIAEADTDAMASGSTASPFTLKFSDVTT